MPRPVKTKGKSYIQKALELFQSRVKKIVTSQELAQLTGSNGKPISHNIRRIFELRDEMGYNIVNHGDNSRTGLRLKVHEWMLLSKEPDLKKIRSRGVNKRIMFEVFERDKRQCQICGRTPTDDDPFVAGRKIRLHVGHRIAHKRKDGEELTVQRQLTAADFITMCSVCNEGAKNSDVKPITLLDRVKTATGEEKKAIADYLKKHL